MIALRRSHFAWLALLYALGVVYSSLVLGPAGLHFVLIPSGEAWNRFLSVRYVDNASNQRPDWIANLLMTVPLAFLVNSAIHGGRGRVIDWAETVASFIVCVLFVLAVKFAQLFFPPRTVTLNYIVAQAIGAGLGVLAFRASKTSALYPRIVRKFEAGEGLDILLAAYVIWLFSWYLFPFDFTLSLGDLALRALAVSDTLFALPGEGRPIYIRVLLILAGTVATVPVGMFLAVRGRERSTVRLVLRGFFLMVAVTMLTLFVLSADTYLLALVYRTLGVYLGISFIARLQGKDLRKRHYYFARFVPVALALYVVALAFINEIFTTDWQPFDQALRSLEPRQLLPFWNFYIVSKARASESVVVHIALYAPIGVMIWFRRGFWAKGTAFSATIAFLLSLFMELARWLKPGFRPDFSDPIVAAAAAALAFRAMPYLWQMFEHEAAMGASLDTYIAQLGAGSQRATTPPPNPDDTESSAPDA